MYIAAGLLFCMLNFVSIKASAKSNISFHHFSYRNSYLFGFPFFTLGVFIREYYKRIIDRINPNKWKIICAILGCVIISLIEVMADKKTTTCPPFIGLSAALILILCLMFKESRLLAKISFLRKGVIDKIYLNIYINHYIFIKIFIALSKKYDYIKSFMKHRYRYALLMMLVSLLLSIITILVSKGVRKLAISAIAKKSKNNRGVN